MSVVRLARALARWGTNSLSISGRTQPLSTRRGLVVTRKAVLVMLVLGLTTAFTIVVGQSVASAAGPIKLSGKDGWACPTGLVTMQFSPPLSAGAATTSSFSLTGTMSDCYETGNAYQSHSTTMKGFTGSMSSNCSILVGESAPPMIDGELKWAPNGPYTFEPSKDITFPSGNAITMNSKDHLLLQWTGATEGSIGKGSLVGNMYLKLKTTMTSAEITAGCATGISSLSFHES